MVRLLLSRDALEIFALFGFNPTMVRLLLGENFAPVGFGIVSIPQWCDCCLKVT